MNLRLVLSFIATSITVGISWVVVYYLSWIPLTETWPLFWNALTTGGFRSGDLTLLSISVFFDILILLVTIYGTYWVLGHFAIYTARYEYYRELMRTQKIERFTVMQRIQHIIMFLTFVVTAFTGFVRLLSNNPMWKEVSISGAYSAAGSPPYFLWIAQTNSLPLTVIIHILAGITMGVLVISHFAYYGVMVIMDLVRKRPLLERWPLLRFYTLGFVKYLIARSIWLIKPSYKLPEWTYKYDPEQLFEYWGVYWGIAILGVPGVLMAVWGPAAFNGLLYLMHVKEAVLAVTFLLLVHITYTHFMPHIFPYNAVFHTGKIPIGIIKEEHPLWYREVVKQLSTA